MLSTKDLYLADNQISDVGSLVIVLKELKRLRSLDIAYNPDLTKAQIAEIQKALPKCRINHNATK